MNGNAILGAGGAATELIINVATGSTLNLTVPLIGRVATRVTKSGGGTLILNGTGSTSVLDTNLQFTGNVSVNGGTLQIFNGNALFNDKAGALPAAQTITINSNAVLALEASGTVFNAGSTSGTFGIRWPIGSTNGITLAGLARCASTPR